MESQTLWKAIKGDLESTLSELVYKSYFSKMGLGECTDSTFEIVCPNYHIAEYVDKRFKGLIFDLIKKITGKEMKVVFRGSDGETKTKVSDLPLFVKPNKEGAVQQSESSGLSEKYTFENFIIGPSNRLAHAIAIAISETPGKVYNPFFLYAGVGLGKTHLIQAIGHQVLKADPKARVVYATAESFMNELIEAIQEGRNKNYSANKFRNKFRKADLLLIDDIQFIAGRGEATQEEFFHTFNALYMSQKQIVLTSDRPPKELSKLDTRITSRFSSGVVADMQKPDLETRSAILREKRDQMRVVVSNDLINFVAEAVETNIRELEGAFLQIITQAKAEGVDITKEFCAKVLGKTLLQEKMPGVNEILRIVCSYYNIKMTDLKGKSRLKEFVLPRQVSMFLLKEFTGTPYVVIGDLLGGRDHTTIMHGVQKMGGLIPRDPRIKQDVGNLRKTLNV